MASTTVFMPQNGYLLAIRSKKPTPALLTVQGFDAATQDILITSFQQQAMVAHQVTQTVGGPEYIFVFGDMLQDLQVGVVVYAKSCAKPDGTADSYKKAWQFYNDKRLRPGKVEIINLTFAGINLRGLLVGFTTQADAAQGSAVIRGTMILKGWTVTESGGGGKSSSNKQTRGNAVTSSSSPVSDVPLLPGWPPSKK